MTGSILLRAAVLAALAGFATAPAWADEAALQKQVEALRAAIAEQRAQLEAQTRLLEAQQAQLDALTRQLEPAKPAPDNDPKLAMNHNRMTITSSDGASSISLRTNVQLDSGVYHQSPEGAATMDFRRGSVGAPPNREINAARDLSDGLYFRRARLGIEGVIARDFSYRFLLELGGSGTEGPARINDAWIAYTGFAPLTIQLGAFAPPANMDDSTSPEDLLFLERATASELSRSLGGADGRMGVGIKAGGDRWMSALTLTARTTYDAEVFDTQSAVVGRVGFLAATADDYNLHLGASGTYVFSPPDQGLGANPRHAQRFRDRPELRVDSTRLIDTGSIGASHSSVAGVEFGANWRSLYLQGEHFWFDVERQGSSTLPDPDFAGYYLQGSWFLTGEQRRYNAATGSYQRPRPTAPWGEGGFGAWEFGARYSRMNLNFMEGIEGTAAAPGAVRGGDQEIITFGINWYLNQNLKVMLDYLMIDVDRLNPAGPGNPEPFGPAPNTPPIGVQIGQDLNAIALRTQFAF